LVSGELDWALVDAIGRTGVKKNWLSDASAQPEPAPTRADGTPYQDSAQILERNLALLAAAKVPKYSYSYEIRNMKYEIQNTKYEILNA
jgi:hypothetical protein